MKTTIWTLLLIGCTNTEKDTAEIQSWNSAPLARISGTCPTIDGSRALQTFTSNDTERAVQFVLPSDPGKNIKPIFFFHGLMPDGSNPTNQLISGLSLQDIADEYNMLFILPVSPVWELFGQRFHLWDIEQGTEENDLTMYDDLRSCVAEHFDVNNSDQIDLDSLGALGFSGGALFTTVVLSNRADTLASAVELSGGGDLSIPAFANPFAVHTPSSHQVPVFLSSGGSSDVWPDASLVVVNFEEATAHLFDEVQANEQISVLCTHDNGHTITPRGWTQALTWLDVHRFGEESPFVEPETDWNDWCVWEPFSLN